MIKNILVMPDSFKGSLESKEFCEIAKNTILSYYPNVNVTCIPLSDGGEGLIDSILSFSNGEKIYSPYTSPIFEKINAYYAKLDNGTYIIESAQASGLPLARDKKSACNTTSLGIGEMICDIIKSGGKKIIIGLGGVATSDFGCGLSYALGCKYYDDNDSLFIPTGGTLNKIKKIDFSQAFETLKNVDITILCDVTNPLYGLNGASYVYARQKGAIEDEIKIIDNGLKHLSDIMKNTYQIDVSNIPGSGAAGGIGGMLCALTKSKPKKGIDTIIELSNLKEIVKNIDLIITGEGKIDKQTLYGKVIYGVCKNKGNAKCICYVGANEIDKHDMKTIGLHDIFSINKKELSLEDNIKNTKNNLKDKIIETIDYIINL